MRCFTPMTLKNFLYVKVYFRLYNAGNIELPTDPLLVTSQPQIRHRGQRVFKVQTNPPLHLAIRYLGDGASFYSVK